MILAPIWSNNRNLIRRSGKQKQEGKVRIREKRQFCFSVSGLSIFDEGYTATEYTTPHQLNYNISNKYPCTPGLSMLAAVIFNLEEYWEDIQSSNYLRYDLSSID